MTKLKMFGIVFLATLFVLGIVFTQDVEKKKTEEVIIKVCEYCKHHADSENQENETEHNCQDNCKNHEGHTCSCKEEVEKSEHHCKEDCKDKHHDSESGCGGNCKSKE